jgi:hypothetical protein
LGNKSSLERHISEITEIPIKALQGVPLSDFSVDERMSWARKRETTRKEDKAYSLLGIFGVYMPLIYGEGEQHALKRLGRQIRQQITEQSDSTPSIRQSRGGDFRFWKSGAPYRLVLTASYSGNWCNAGPE